METKMKQCQDCKMIKSISEFYFRSDNKKYRNECKKCFKKEAQKYRNRPGGKEKTKEVNKKYREENKEELKIKDREKRRKQRKNPIYKLRLNVSRSIHRSLFAVGKSKAGQSMFQYLPYTIEDLKNHIENLFSHPDNLINGKIWMTWGNYGKYNANTWHDNDFLTWTWELDHIIPHSEFKYESMNDKLFLECWTLSNLRPYSAKQNLLDGSTKIRHKVSQKIKYKLNT